MSFTAHSVCASRRQMPQCVERPLLLFPYHPLFDVYTPIAHVDPSYIHKSTVHILFVPKMKVSFLSFFVCVCECVFRVPMGSTKIGGALYKDSTV